MPKDVVNRITNRISQQISRRKIFVRVGQLAAIAGGLLIGERLALQTALASPECCIGVGDTCDGLSCPSVCYQESYSWYCCGGATGQITYQCFDCLIKATHKACCSYAKYVPNGPC